MPHSSVRHRPSKPRCLECKRRSTAVYAFWIVCLLNESDGRRLASHSRHRSRHSLVMLSLHLRSLPTLVYMINNSERRWWTIGCIICHSPGSCARPMVRFWVTFLPQTSVYNGSVTPFLLMIFAW